MDLCNRWRIFCDCDAGRRWPGECLDGCSWVGLELVDGNTPSGWRTLVAADLQTAVTSRLFSHAWAPCGDCDCDPDLPDLETAFTPGRSRNTTGITDTISFHPRDRDAPRGHTVDAAKPEPATVALAGLGGAFILRRRRR